MSDTYLSLTDIIKGLDELREMSISNLQNTPLNEDDMATYLGRNWEDQRELANYDIAINALEIINHGIYGNKRVT